MRMNLNAAQSISPEGIRISNTKLKNNFAQITNVFVLNIHGNNMIIPQSQRTQIRVKNLYYD
jgi:hypothetical protein